MFVLISDCEEVPGALTQIDASNGQIFGVNSEGYIYTLYSVYGNPWIQLPGALTHVTTGPSGVWGVDSYHNVYRLVGGNWILITGSLKQIDAGGSQFVVGVNMNDEICCLPKSSAITADDNSSLSWIHIEGKFKYYSCGPLGCWGVNSADTIYYRHGVTPDSCTDSRWQNVPGALSMIEVGTEGDVYGVNSAGDIYRREGITKENPIGTTWEQVDKKIGKAKHVSYDLDRLWVVTTEGNIFKCKQPWVLERTPGRYMVALA
ncbi:PREDICTED: fish-egg lectin-like [Gekko japonicus]|uniref:Fish-egg lectin-like n=1 Tax=Gekko japonicus TaxID=146911 RepID=A0ABM1JJ65_GEKJA|nr:PREDICTED: fish-egg lectin-like [Gekko japonicus]